MLNKCRNDVPKDGYDSRKIDSVMTCFVRGGTVIPSYLGMPYAWHSSLFPPKKKPLKRVAAGLYHQAKLFNPQEGEISEKNPISDNFYTI